VGGVVVFLSEDGVRSITGVSNEQSVTQSSFVAVYIYKYSKYGNVLARVLTRCVLETKRFLQKQSNLPLRGGCREAAYRSGSR
jgi:hypothetical protein